MARLRRGRNRDSLSPRAESGFPLAKGGIGIPSRGALAGLALSIGILAPVGGAPEVACAAEQPRAVLVVDTGEQDLRYCVALGDDEVSGIELIVLAGSQHGLAYRLGFGGSAVCMLAGVGPAGDDCFEDYPNFWGYWRTDGAGGWSWSGSGAASTSVSDGDVEGWSWGSGDDGDSHSAPPATAFRDVCKSLPEPPPPPKKKDSDRGRHEGVAAVDPGPGSSPSAPGSGPPPQRPEREPRRATDDKGAKSRARVPQVRDEYNALPTADPSPVTGEPASVAGPPVAGLTALVVSAALVAAGALVRTRRRRAR